MSSNHTLAILGGEKAFSSPVHVGRPNLVDREGFLNRMQELLDRRWLTNDGPLVREFERRIAELTGVQHCIAVANGTIALELVAKALGLSGEVIVPAFTFVATAHALAWQGITPVFCDINASTHNLDPEAVEACLTNRTQAILGVHVWGRPCPIDALEQIAQRHNLKLFFDAAHALGCSYRGQMIGGFGDAEVLSFHATKILHTFEGGAILTNNGELAKKLRLMRNFGFVDYDKVLYLGINGKMNEVCAAMGLTLLDHFGELVDWNRCIYAVYRRSLCGIQGIRLISYPQDEKCNYQYVVLEVDETCPVSRDGLIKVLHMENVIARRYFYPGCHKMEPYATSLRYRDVVLPQTEKIASRVLVLPTGTSVSESDAETICRIIRTAIANASAVNHVLASMV